MSQAPDTHVNRFPWPLVLVGVVTVGSVVVAGTGTSFTRSRTASDTVATASAVPSASPVAVLPTQPSTVHPGYGNKPLPKGGVMVGTTITHTVQPGQYLETVAGRYLVFTDYYTWPELSKAIKAANHLKRDWVNPGEKLVIPNVRAAAPKAQVIPKPKGFAAKGCYITNTSAASPRVFSIIKQLKPLGLNAIVFDAKDMSGIIGYDSQVPLVRQMKADREGLIHDMPKFIEKCHKEGIHVIARVTQFFDVALVKKHPEWSVRFKQGGLFHEGSGVPTWADPSRKEVQDYNIAIMTEMAGMGVDEIQLDYIRFPAMGRTHDAVYAFDPKTTPKYQVIADYLGRVRQALKPYQALLSADVYGTVAWDQPIDVRITGQRLEAMAPNLDVISSMLYPSHFYGTFDNFSYPPDHPYYFYEKGVAKVYNKTAAHGVVNRPWVQAFPYRIRNYGPDYIRQQLQGSYDAGGNGWLLWNANNDYDMAARALTGWQEKETDKRKQAMARLAKLAAGLGSDATAVASEVQAAAPASPTP
jgi:hypothetical protein